MRTLGLIGGMAWPSTLHAYEQLNLAVASARGGVSSAPLIVWSFNFAQIEALQRAGDWARLDEMMVEAAVRLEAAGAEGLMICTNTMHISAPAILAAVDIPLLHIADETARAVRSAGAFRVGLLGTQFTMEQDFYIGRLREHGLDVIVPDEAGRVDVHRIIYDELVLGQIESASRARYVEIADDLVERGAQGIIAGCTEIELLLKADDVPVPYFPTTAIHVAGAVDWILDD